MKNLILIGLLATTMVGCIDLSSEDSDDKSDEPIISYEQSLSVDFQDGVRGIEKAPALESVDAFSGDILRLNTDNTLNFLQTNEFNFQFTVSEDRDVLFVFDSGVMPRDFRITIYDSVESAQIKAYKSVVLHALKDTDYFISVEAKSSFSQSANLVVVEANRESLGLKDDEYLVQYAGTVVEENCDSKYQWSRQYVYNFVEGYLFKPEDSVRVKLMNIRGATHELIEEGYSVRAFDRETIYRGNWKSSHFFDPKTGGSSVSLTDDYTAFDLNGNKKYSCVGTATDLQGKVVL